MATNGLQMKLLIDTKAQRVCFAEAGRDVFEFFSCLLGLPMSTDINLLTKERMVDSIGNVLASVQDLDGKFVISSKSKEPYLSPAVAPTVLCPLQKLLDAPLNASTKFFTLEGKSDYYGVHPCGYFSAAKGSKCPSCSKTMASPMKHVKPNGFAVGMATYTIMDDLSITPACSVSSVAMLAECGVTDLSSLQQKTVKIGKEEVAHLRRRYFLDSLKSKTVLTDVFLQKEKVLWKKEA
uniref:Uncharacterized protein n=1 Tax=Setaria viridis TaxID=4556 RepID=A0A4U6UFV0_SETVI|nr:hypothetical protein SEVIR_5G106300v2 [Setaria viridis]